MFAGIENTETALASGCVGAGSGQRFGEGNGNVLVWLKSRGVFGCGTGIVEYHCCRAAVKCRYHFLVAVGNITFRSILVIKSGIAGYKLNVFRCVDGAFSIFIKISFMTGICIHGMLELHAAAGITAERKAVDTLGCIGHFFGGCKEVIPCFRYVKSFFF